MSGLRNIILYEKTSVIEQAKDIYTLFIKETFCIMLAAENLLNKDWDTAVLDCWKSLSWQKCQHVNPEHFEYYEQ